MFRLNDKAVLFLPPNTVEAQALKQIENTSSMGFVFKHVAVMPDCHFGKGATVGTVLATKGAIIPAAVGVDIGCGMVAVKTRLGRGDIKDPAQIRRDIERRIPMSAGRNNKTLTPTAAPRVAQLESLAGKDYASIDRAWPLALGTLGGGNHFIELATDESGAGVGHAAFRIARHRQQDRQSTYQESAAACATGSGLRSPIGISRTWSSTPESSTITSPTCAGRRSSPASIAMK